MDWLDDTFIALLALLVSASHASWQATKHWAQRARLSIHPVMEANDKQGRRKMTINVKNVGFSPVTIVDWGIEEVERPCSFRTRWLFLRRPRKSIRGYPVLYGKVESYTPTVLNPGQAGGHLSAPFTLDGIMGEIWVKDSDGKFHTHLRTHLQFNARWPAVRYAVLR